MPEYLPLVAGLALTLLAVLVARHRISAVESDILEKTAPREIVVASSPVARGATFSLENLAKRPVPSAGTSHRNVPAKDFELLLGAKAKIDISEGEPVLWTDVEEPFEVESFSRIVPPGRRAVTIDVETKDSFSGLLRVGDYVDILRQHADGRSFIPLLEDVRILALDRNFLPSTSGEDNQDVATITVSVSPEDAVRLSAASRGGNLSWLLRNPDDRSRNRQPTRLAYSASEVEIWKAGIRERNPPAIAQPGVLE